MAVLAPFFKYDVFVSYAHGTAPGGIDSPLKRWTRRFIDDLTSGIHAVSTKFKALEVWWDEHIDETMNLTPEIQAKVEASGILMVIMSQRYLESSWCMDELQWFRQKVPDQGRVFIVRALHTSEIDWPACLRDDRGHAIPGFRFHNPPDEMPYCWEGTDVLRDEYVKRLWRLQLALTERLRELHGNAEKEQQIRLSLASGGLIKGPRRVYIHARPEYAPLCDDVRRALTEDGIVPLTSTVHTSGNMLDWRGESAERINKATRCEALALLRADGDVKFIGDLIDIGLDERDRIESARGKPLPCAVLDRSGEPPPIDLRSHGIQHFDICNSDWRTKFRGWLDQPPSHLVTVS
jgi:hypothetical protein